MRGDRPRLAFVSPIFLFPLDAGGKIRTTNILRGLRGGRFDITLFSPASGDQPTRFAEQIAQVCDRFEPWQAAPKPRWLRAFDLIGDLPVNVAADRTPGALHAVERAAASGGFDVMVFDFVHSAVLLPASLRCPSICFTHNVEAEIFARHADHAANGLMRRVWAAQYRKMLAFEARALGRFTSVIAVSERDAKQFRSGYGLPRVEPIPTGVDLDYFSWQSPPALDDAGAGTVVFTGSMDSAANIGGVRFFIESVWPAIRARRPQARFIVVGRNPPSQLVALSRSFEGVEFTGSVEDVRPYMRDAHAFVIPLLVGGGTRIKAFEAMATGCPVVSTTIGIEGLDVEPDTHYLRADAPAELAAAVIRLLDEPRLRQELSTRARDKVEGEYGHAAVAAVFERICTDALRTGPAATPGKASALPGR